MKKALLTGTGCYAPPDVISNAELVASFNAYVQQFNDTHAAAIASGEMQALRESSVEFIVKASGIKNRHVIDKKHILDPDIMQPILPERENGELSLQAEMAVIAAKEALANAGKRPEDVDILLVSCSNLQRAYPAVSIEVQAALGCSGYAYDMNVACSSATFGLQAAVNALVAGSGKVALVISPEITTGHMNFRDRDSHFIFGDASTALVLETADTCSVEKPFEVVSTRLQTTFSNNIRNNFGFLNWTWPETMHGHDKLFSQQGRQVFKEVVPMAARVLTQHLHEENLTPADLKRLWLHQANRNMNDLIAYKILGHDATQQEAPLVLDEYANTASAGSAICLHYFHDDMDSGDLGLMSSFGAGYSIGSVILRRL
jgi:beta-ketodecanoyl-[acyl-carrier-protein] synthase